MENVEAIDDRFSKTTNIKSLCRACLCLASNEESPLFEMIPSLAVQIETFAGIKLEIGEGLPNTLCHNCFSDLQTVQSFRSRCRRSESLLRRYFSDSSIVKLEGGECHNINIDNLPTDFTKDDKTEIKIDSNINNTQAEWQMNVKSESSNSDNFTDDDDIQFQKKTADTNIGKNDPSIIINKNNRSIDKKFTCEICSKPLSTKVSLKLHIMKIHNREKNRIGKVSGWGSNKRFYCVECPYSTPHSQSLTYHVRRHTGEKPFKCEKCGKCFSQPSSLSCHMKTHSDKMFFTCAECGKQFKYKETYEAHKKVHMDIVMEYVCTLCSKNLKSKKTLESHMNRHNNIKNFSCETCGALFVTRVELLNHSKKHKDERKFICNLCDFKTYMKKALVTHLRRHTGERPFKCDMCELSCYTKGELNIHRRTHTKEKNYSCPVCEMRFTHSSSVNKHMLRCHNIKYKRMNTVDRRVIK